MKTKISGMGWLTDLRINYNICVFDLAWLALEDNITNDRLRLNLGKINQYFNLIDTNTSYPFTAGFKLTIQFQKVPFVPMVKISQDISDMQQSPVMLGKKCILEALILIIQNYS